LHLTPVVADFLAEHPGVQADLTLHDRNLDLIEGELHVALRIGPLADSSLLVRKLGEVRRLVVAAPDYLARCGTPLEPADLAEHDTS
jgi:DNA-binding transcriptional LysR family regulator